MSDTGSLLAAMLAVQAEAPTLKKDAENPHFRSKYAPLDTIVETINPLLVKNGLVWSTMPSFDDTTGEPTLIYELAHAPTGELKSGEMKLLLSKGDPQGQGSAITYARRYALVSVLNLVADDDDDGHAASQGAARNGNARGGYGQAKASEKQIGYVKKLLKMKKATVADIRAMLKGAGLSVTDGSDVSVLIDGLSGPQASEMIEFLKDGKSVPTGESDVPPPADDEFRHPAEDETAGTGQFDVGPS